MKSQRSLLADLKTRSVSGAQRVKLAEDRVGRVARRVEGVRDDALGRPLPRERVPDGVEKGGVAEARAELGLDGEGQEEVLLDVAVHAAVPGGLVGRADVLVRQEEVLADAAVAVGGRRRLTSAQEVLKLVERGEAAVLGRRVKGDEVEHRQLHLARRAMAVEEESDGEERLQPTHVGALVDQLGVVLREREVLQRHAGCRCWCRCRGERRLWRRRRRRRMVRRGALRWRLLGVVPLRVAGLRVVRARRAVALVVVAVGAVGGRRRAGASGFFRAHVGSPWQSRRRLWQRCGSWLRLRHDVSDWYLGGLRLAVLVLLFLNPA